MPYRTYDGYGTWTTQPDTIYDGYGGWIRNPALPPDYDGYGNFWNKETDPNWIPPEAPAAAPEAPAPEAPAPAPVAPPIDAPIAAPAAAAPVTPAVDPNAPLGAPISAGTPVTSKLQTTPTSTGAKLAQTIVSPDFAATSQKPVTAGGSISVTK
jgi:hypothetical protein